MSDETQRRTSRFFAAGLVVLLLTGLLSALGGFIVWVGLGAAVWLFFMSMYVSGVTFFQRRPADPYQSTYSSGRPTAPATPAGRSKAIVAVVFFLMIILMMFGIIYSITSAAGGEDSAEAPIEETPASDEVDTWINTGNDFYNQSQFDSAKVYYSKALAREPRNSYALYDMSLITYNKGEYRKTLDYLYKSLAVNNQSADTYTMVAATHFQMHQLDSSRFYIDKATAMGGNSAWMNYMRGEILLQSGDRAEARKAFEESLQQDSAQTDIYRRLIELDPDRRDFYNQKIRHYNP